MMDASDNGAKLTLTQPVESLQLRQFFLKLSTTGSSFRRCELAWMNDNEVGVGLIEKAIMSIPSSESHSNQEPLEI